MKNRFAVAALAALSLTAFAVPTLVTSKPNALAAAVASANRPDTDKVRDGARKPVELMTFAGIATIVWLKA